jgi:hypothetical protein
MVQGWEGKGCAQGHSLRTGMTLIDVGQKASWVTQLPAQTHKLRNA